jgi:lysine biosynthesis protein LysW
LPGIGQAAQNNEELKMAKAYCPNCDAAVVKDNPRIGTTITCRECGTDLEIISLNPFEVDFPLDYDEDFDDDWEDEEEEDEAEEDEEDEENAY